MKQVGGQSKGLIAKLKMQRAFLEQVVEVRM